MSGALLTGTFPAMWAALEPVGRDPGTGGYRRFAWTGVDAQLREWFTGEASTRGADVTRDRAGNLWAWWGDPDRDGPGLVLGSHLDSVPDGGAFDGPLGIVSAFAALDEVRARDAMPRRPVAVACFADEEGARFGVACAGSRLLTGTLDPDRARALTDDAGVPMAEAMAAAGLDPAHVGRDEEALARIGCFVELHVEQGRALAGPHGLGGAAVGAGPNGLHSPDVKYVGSGGAPVGVGHSIHPHGRWRFDLLGRADHAGTTSLADRADPMLDLARLVLAARSTAEARGVLATIGKVTVEPNGVNAIPSRVRAWLDARGADAAAVRGLVTDLERSLGVTAEQESWTPATELPADLRERVAACLPGAPVLPTGAGHDAGILAAAGVPAAMLFVRNPSGVSHSPAEHAELDDCLAGVAALAQVVEEIA